jgi:3-oxoacyl-[acyl-carrier protein] reductase
MVGGSQSPPKREPPIYPDLAGKVAFVTGGSKGIGAAVCRMFAANGTGVAVVAREQSPIEEIVADLHDRGAAAVGISADVTNAESVGRACMEAEEALGPADVVVPYAGGFSSSTPIWEIPESEWRDVLDLNLTATFTTMRAFLPGMIERRRGSIVVMSSVVARNIDRSLTASYAAAKAGALMLVRHAAVELGPFGIRVNAIAPGTVRSERTDRMMSDHDREQTARLSPLGRMGHADDCAAATLFLASDAANWITGAALDVSGGRAML